MRRFRIGKLAIDGPTVWEDVIEIVFDRICSRAEVKSVLRHLIKTSNPVEFKFWVDVLTEEEGWIPLTNCWDCYEKEALDELHDVDDDFWEWYEEETRPRYLLYPEQYCENMGIEYQDMKLGRNYRKEI